MQIRILPLCLLIITFVIAACQGPPPTQIVLVVTATPDGEATSCREYSYRS